MRRVVMSVSTMALTDASTRRGMPAIVVEYRWAAVVVVVGLVRVVLGIIRLVVMVVAALDVAPSTSGVLWDHVAAVVAILRMVMRVMGVMRVPRMSMSVSVTGVMAVHCTPT